MLKRSLTIESGYVYAPYIPLLRINEDLLIIMSTSEMKNQDLVHYSNVVDYLNEKYMNEEPGTMRYPFSVSYSTHTTQILLFGSVPLWDVDEGFSDHEKEPEGEELEKAIIAICEEEYGEIINNLYGGYAIAHNRNFGPNNTVEAEVPYNGGDDNIVLTHYRKAGQFVNEDPKGARVYHTEHKLYASCHEHDSRFKNKLAAMAELNEMLKERKNE